MQPGFYAQTAEPIPDSRVRQHMHQVIINVICPETAQFLQKDFVKVQGFAYQIMGQLCSNIYPVAETVFL